MQYGKPSNRINAQDGLAEVVWPGLAWLGGRGSIQGSCAYATIVNYRYLAWGVLQSVSARYGGCHASVSTTLTCWSSHSSCDVITATLEV